MRRHIHNAISLARLLAAPVLARWIWNREYEYALILLAVAGLPALLEVFLSRRWKVASQSGAYLDPLADKALLVSAYIAGGLDGLIPAWLMWLVLGRDLLILSMVAAGFAFTAHRSFPPALTGKLSTVVQIFYGLVLLYNRSMLADENRAGPVENAMFWAVAAITIVSGLDYMVRGYRMLRSDPAASG